MFRGIYNALASLFAENQSRGKWPLSILGVPMTKPHGRGYMHRLLSAGASVNNTLVRTGPGSIGRVRGYNAKASAVFIKFYDKATAPVAGTDTPIATYRLTNAADFDITVDLDVSLGIGYAITGAAADADTTALTAADVVCLNLSYS